MTFGVNHLGHFLLTKLLLPVLRKSKARVVNVASLAHTFARRGIPFEELKNPSKEKYDMHENYGISKLANILFSKMLSERERDISSFSLHPGIVITNFFSSFKLLEYGAKIVGSLLFKTPLEG